MKVAGFIKGQLVVQKVRIRSLLGSGVCIVPCGQDDEPKLGAALDTRDSGVEMLY